MKAPKIPRWLLFALPSKFSMLLASMFTYVITYRAYHCILEKDREAHGNVTPGECDMNNLDDDEQSRAFQKQVDATIAEREAAAGDDESGDDDVDPEAVRDGSGSG